MARPYTRSIISTEDVERTASLGVSADGLDDAGIDIIHPTQMKALVEDEKFMNEKVVIEVEMDDEPNAPVFIQAGHNGVTQYIRRGEPQTVKRKFLYALIAAKQVKLAVAFGRNGDGSEFNRATPTAKSSYRTRLISDSNPNGGMKWVQSVTASL